MSIPSRKPQDSPEHLALQHFPTNHQKMSTPSNNEERLRLQLSSVPEASSSPMVFPSSSAGHPTSDAAPQSGPRVQGIRRAAQNYAANSSSPLQFPSSSNSTVRGRRSGRGNPSSEPLFFSAIFSRRYSPCFSSIQPPGRYSLYGPLDLISIRPIQASSATSILKCRDRANAERARLRGPFAASDLKSGCPRGARNSDGHLGYPRLPPRLYADLPSILARFQEEI